MADMNFRTPLDFPLPVKQIRHYIQTSTSGAEKKVWRDMLNGPEYNKHKADKLKKEKEAKPEVKAKGKKK